jgi:hypothetical protein
MLKKSASFVLSSSKSSTYPRGYASGFDSPAALLDEPFEHPADRQAREVKCENWLVSFVYLVCLVYFVESD